MKPALLPESRGAALFGRIAKKSRARLQRWHRDEDRHCKEGTCRFPKPVPSPVYGSDQDPFVLEGANPICRDSWRAAVRTLIFLLGTQGH